MSDYEIKGLAELQRALEQLPAKIEANIIQGALRAGAKVVAAAARDNVSVVSGRLAASVRYGAKRTKALEAQGYVRAGGRGKGKRAGAFYAHMVEYGTAAHIIKAPPGAKLNVRGVFYSSVQHPGARKKPFMRPALDSHAQAALEAVREYIRVRLATKHGIEVPAPVDPEAEE